jgi:hypothetical protein
VMHMHTLLLIKYIIITKVEKVQIKLMKKKKKK